MATCVIILAHISPCFLVKEGDHVIIGQSRPLSKIVRFNVLKMIPAGSSGGGKKAFTTIHITRVCNVVKSSLFAR
ncbi:40S ribosomal protein S11 [Camellia lanceoleosa]|uniref:40S ribosomal protein S11 n=1 Tax=Camellia lanceoleosa TaxID=1840588 RepID=A0ACC0G4F1_9ERIC|nr:40S ribosomal protein S11 [Camellia lanceoleosa]